MRFKFITALASLILFFGASSSLFADGVYPLGLVIRPAFIDHLISRLNQQNRELELTVESDIFSFRGTVQGQWNTAWNVESGNLVFPTDLRKFKIAGDLYARNSKGNWELIRPQTKSIATEIDYLPLLVTINPNTLEIQLDLRLDSEELLSQLPPDKTRKLDQQQDEARELILNKMALGIRGFEQINRRLNDIGAKQKVLEAFLSEGGKALSDFFQKTIYGLGYGEFLSKSTPLSPLWKRGPLYQKDALTLELLEPSTPQKEIAFAFHRFAENGMMATNDRLELYVNAIFLTHDLFGTLTGLNTNFTDPETLLSQSMTYLKNHPARFAPDWRRPKILPSSSDLSVVIPKSLINLALTTVYKEGLLRFQTKLDLGKTTKNLLSPEAPQTYLVVNINPNQPPRLDFDADRLQLDITNYSLDIGTLIEDRIIPQATLQTNTNISASLAVDNSAQYINLELKPDTFQIKLDDSKNRLTEKERAIFQRVSENLWRSFLTSYSQLNLFKTVVNTERAPITIKEVRVAGQNILMDLDIEWEKSKL